MRGYDVVQYFFVYDLNTSYFLIELFLYKILIYVNNDINRPNKNKIYYVGIHVQT